MIETKFVKRGQLIRSVPAERIARPNKIRLDSAPPLRLNMQSKTDRELPSRTSSSLVTLPFDSINVPPGRSPYRNGFLTSAWYPKPIAVGSTPDGPRLAAGQHWFEVAKTRGDTRIQCMFVTDEDDARLCEIEEILGYGRLTVLDKAALVAEYLQILGRAGLCGQNVQKVGGKMGRPVGGTAQAARVLCVPGKTEEARRKWIERAIAINRLSPEAKAAATEGGMGDHQRALLQAARQPTPTAQLESVLASVEAARKPKLKSHRKPGPETAMPTADETARITAELADNKSGKIRAHESEQESMHRVDLATDIRQPEHLALEDSLTGPHELPAETQPVVEGHDLAMDTSADEVAFGALISAWRAASAIVRDRFVKQVLRETADATN
jgi:hypothetical protein